MSNGASLSSMYALTLIACTSAHAASNDACALLTPAQVSAVLGAPVNDGEALSPTHREYCSFNEAGKAGGSGRNVHISIIDEKKFTLGKTPVSGVEKTPESGLGDEAYWSKAQGMVYARSVKKGSNYVRVQSRTNKDAFAKANTPALDEQDRAVDRKLALEILKKL
jgi:hypothetical protein